jgi:threonine dehydrogenase-like Zn-dependent dehydrogenase
MMRAIVFKDNQLELVEDYPKPEPREGEALIRVLAAGICRTDLEIIQGYMGFSGVLGHEFVGKVVSSRRPELQDRRVVGEINCGCGRCFWCRRGLARHCPGRRVLGIKNKDGALAEYLTLPEDNLHLLPDEVTDLEGVLVEPLAAAYEILEQVQIQPQQRVLLLGDGKLGLLIAQVIRLTGAELTVAGKHPDRLAWLASQGITTCPLAQLDDHLYEVVIEASGSPQGIELALDRVLPRGTVVLKTTTASPSSLQSNELVIKEIRLVGSRCGPYPPAIRALAGRLVQVGPLTGRLYRLDQGLEAFRQAGNPGTLKVILRMDP